MSTPDYREPWIAKPDPKGGLDFEVINNNGEIVRVDDLPHAIACVNALAGVSDEAIKAGAVRELVEAALQYSCIDDDEVNDGQSRREDLEALRSALEPFAGMKGGKK